MARAWRTLSNSGRSRKHGMSSRQLLSVRRRGTTPTDIPRPGPTRPSVSGPQVPRKEPNCRSGHDAVAADIDPGGREGAVRLLGGGGGRDVGTGFELALVRDFQTLNYKARADDELFLCRA